MDCGLLVEPTELIFSGMIVGILLMLFYMTKFKFGWFGGGSGTVGYLEVVGRGPALHPELVREVDLVQIIDLNALGVYLCEIYFH